MNILTVSMLPFVANALCCKLPTYHQSSMPKVVPDQREKFENNELFRKLSREAEVRYTGHRDRPHEERKVKFQTECREGRADIAYTSSGINLMLSFISNSWSDRPEEHIPTKEFVDFEKEPGKVHLKSQFIMDGVCVVWKGWIDLQRLDGAGYLEFDADRARVEDALLRQQIEQLNRNLEERQRRLREEQERQAEAEAEVAQSLLQYNPPPPAPVLPAPLPGLSSSTLTRSSSTTAGAMPFSTEEGATSVLPSFAGASSTISRLPSTTIRSPVTQMSTNGGGGGSSSLASWPSTGAFPTLAMPSPASSGGSFIDSGGGGGGSSALAWSPSGASLAMPSPVTSVGSFIDTGGGGRSSDLLPTCRLSPLSCPSRPLLSLDMTSSQEPVSQQPLGSQPSGFQPYVPGSSNLRRGTSLHGRFFTRQGSPPSSTVTLGMHSSQSSAPSVPYLPQGDIDEPFSQPHGMSPHYVDQPSMSYSSRRRSSDKESPPPHT